MELCGLGSKCLSNVTCSSTFYSLLYVRWEYNQFLVETLLVAYPIPNLPLVVLSRRLILRGAAMCPARGIINKSTMKCEEVIERIINKRKDKEKNELIKRHFWGGKTRVQWLISKSYHLSAVEIVIFVFIFILVCVFHKSDLDFFFLKKYYRKFIQNSILFPMISQSALPFMNYWLRSLANFFFIGVSFAPCWYISSYIIKG